MIKYIIPLMLLGFALSSHADSPTGGAAGKSGCYTVSGQIYQAVGPGGLSGTISGDVIGEVVTVAGPIEVHGVVFFRPAEMTWNVTGGIVEPLIGESVRFEYDFVGIFAQPPLIIFNNNLRVVEGAKKGNLTMRGWTDVSAFTSYAEYHGVICL